MLPRREIHGREMPLSSPGPFIAAVVPKELAPVLGRSVRWVRFRCASREIATLPVGKPYRIPPDEANRLAGLKPDHPTR